MVKLTNVNCYNSGGGVIIYTALLNGDVWFETNLETYSCYDIPFETVSELFLIDENAYREHSKTPSAPLPTWSDIVDSLKPLHDRTSTISFVINLIENEYNLSDRIDANLDRVQ